MGKNKNWDWLRNGVKGRGCSSEGGNNTMVEKFAL
jgi:hypothetical protein